MPLFNASNNGIGITSNIAWFFRAANLFTAAGVQVGWIVNGENMVNAIVTEMTIDPDPDQIVENNSILITVDSKYSFIAGRGYDFTPPSVACFVEGTKILTNDGYKAVEELELDDLVITSDNRAIEFKIMKMSIEKTTEITAPYLIKPGAFGKNNPVRALHLSSTHKVQLRKGLWISPEIASKTNPLVNQYGVGEPVTYYHIVCENYLKDNLIAEGSVVESYGSVNSLKGLKNVYKWSTRMGGFTRIGYSSLLNTIMK